MSFAPVLVRLAVAALGVFAGANLVEGFILVPYWRSLTPERFFAWYAANDRRLLGFFGPLTAIVALVVMLATAASWWAAQSGAGWMVVAAATMLVAVMMFPLYFQAANARFAAASIAPNDLAGALAAWDAWHRVRTVLAVAALAASLLAS